MASTTKRNSEALDARSSSDIESVIAQVIALEKSAQSRQALAVLSTWLARIDIAEGEQLELNLLAASNEFIVCNYPAAHKRLADAAALADRLAKPVALARVKFLSARTLHQQGSPSAAFPLALEAMQELQALGEYAQAARASQTLIYISLDRCEYADAVTYGERAVKALEKMQKEKIDA